MSSQFKGLVAPERRIEEDAEGATLWSSEVEAMATPPRVIARALGQFASVRIEDPGWFVVGRLRDRIEQAEVSESDEFVAEDVDPETRHLAEAVWGQRAEAFSVLDALPHVLSHGDALPRNLMRHDGSSVTAIDWDQLGYAPVGADLATFSMWIDEPVENLFESYLNGASDVFIDAFTLRFAVALTTSLIAIFRAYRTAGTAQFDGYHDRLVKASLLMRLALHELG